MKPQPRMLVLATTAILGLAAATPAAAGTHCDRSPEIRAAFEPRLDYEHERALQLAGAEDEWATSIRRDFEAIAADGLDCRTVYDRLNAYLDDVIARNDHLAQTSRTRGVIFRKW